MRSVEENEGRNLLSKWKTSEELITLSFNGMGDALSFRAIGKIEGLSDESLKFAGQECDVFLDLSEAGFEGTVSEALLAATGMLRQQSEGTKVVLRTGDTVSLVAVRRVGTTN